MRRTRDRVALHNCALIIQPRSAWALPAQPCPEVKYSHAKAAPKSLQLFSHQAYESTPLRLWNAPVAEKSPAHGNSALCAVLSDRSHHTFDLDVPKCPATKQHPTDPWCAR